MWQEFSFIPQHLYGRLKSFFSRWGTQIAESWSHFLDSEPQSTCPLPLRLLTAEGKLEVTSAILHPAKWPSLRQSFCNLPVRSNHVGSVVQVQIPCCTCRGIWIYLQESEFLTTTPGRSEADFHFEDGFSIGINKISANKYPSTHPCIYHVHVYLEEFL